MYKTFRIETIQGEVLADGYGSLEGCRLDAKDMQPYFEDGLLIFDENNTLYK